MMENNSYQPVLLHQKCYAMATLMKASLVLISYMYFKITSKTNLQVWK